MTADLDLHTISAAVERHRSGADNYVISLILEDRGTAQRAELLDRLWSSLRQPGGGGAETSKLSLAFLISVCNAALQIVSLGISGSLPDLMIRMLVQSKPREIALLPALPEQFTAGSIDGIPCRGQVLVKSLGWKEKQIHVILNSKIEQTVTLKFPGEIAEVRKVAGKTKTSQSGRANQLRLTLLAEEDTNLNIELKWEGVVLRVLRREHLAVWKADGRDTVKCFMARDHVLQFLDCVWVSCQLKLKRRVDTFGGRGWMIASTSSGGGGKGEGQNGALPVDSALASRKRSEHWRSLPGSRLKDVGGPVRERASVHGGWRGFLRTVQFVQKLRSGGTLFALTTGGPETEVVGSGSVSDPATMRW